MSEELENLLRTLGGVLAIIFTMICCVYCLYKYAVCQEREEKSRVVHVKSDKNNHQVYQGIV